VFIVNLDRSNMKNISNSFIEMILFIKQQARDQLKKELCKENWIVLRFVWYYEDPYIVIPEHLRELGLIE